jgi:catechol 2,3-dioxygenase-like lactoylglutathione lyase family enzyme
MFVIKKIQHVGIPVTNLELSAAFYKRLGFENAMSSLFTHKDNEGKVCMMKSGDIIPELYQMPEADLNEIRKRKNGHIDHIAFDVNNIDETFEYLKNNAFDLIEESPVFLPFWSSGCKYLYITGPDGERLEFNQIL